MLLFFFYSFTNLTQLHQWQKWLDLCCLLPQKSIQKYSIFLLVWSFDLPRFYFFIHSRVEIKILWQKQKSSEKEICRKRSLMLVHWSPKGMPMFPDSAQSRYLTSVFPDKIIIVIGNYKWNWNIPTDNTEFLKTDISRQNLQHLTKSNTDCQLCSWSEITRNSHLHCQDLRAVGTALPMAPMSPMVPRDVTWGWGAARANHHPP